MANSSVAHVLCVVLALCYLQTSLTDSSWDYRGAKNKAAAVTQATGSVSPSAPSSKSVNAAALSTAGRSRPGSLNNVTRGQGACGDAMFNDWAGTFNYSFSGQARQAAQKRFCNNMEQVKKINTNMSIPYWASGNAYTHLSFEEFAQRFLIANLTTEEPQAVKAPSKATPSRKLLQDVTEGPASYVNWVEQDKVTPIRSQGGCSSCWAFAAVTVLESMYLIANNGSASDPAMRLSEQQLVSCVNRDSGFWSAGCRGGSTPEALDYVASNGLLLNSLYPYNATTGTCNMDLINSTAPDQTVKSSGFHQQIRFNDETSLIKAVEAAPTAVYFAVDSSFFLYSGGIYTPLPTNNNQVNHGMVLVGYNNTSGSDRHWLLRNSWGEGWGEKGYARVIMTGTATRNVGPCGMYQYAFQPSTGFSSPALQLSTTEA